MFYLFKLFIKKRWVIFEKNSFQLTHNIKNQYVWQATTIISILFYFFLFFNYNINLSIDIIYLTYKNSIVASISYLYNKFVLNFKLMLIFNTVYYFDVTNDRVVFFDKITLFIQDFVNFYEYYFDHGYFTVLNKFNLNFESILQIIRYLFTIFILLIFISTLYIYFFNLFLSYNLFLLFILFLISFIVLHNNFTFFYKINYINFLIDESFLNRNLYVDSNYFLTNDSMRGIEKFSDITSPWLVDFEDFGWGGEFKIQPIVKQIIERERRLILENMYIDNSPNMENSNVEPGTLKTRFLKLIRRLEVFSFYINSFMNDRYKIKNTWKKQYFYKNEKLFDYGVNSMVKPLRLQISSNMLSNKSFLSDSTITPKLTFKYILKDDIKKFGYTFRMNNSFFLSKKNNITNDVNMSGSNVKDRRSVVFRNVINSLDTIDKTQNISSRRPDVNIDSNYIFERQLQEGRVLDYELKKYLLSYLKQRYKYYYQNKIFFNLKQKYITNQDYKFTLKINKNNLFDLLNINYGVNSNESQQHDLKKKYKTKYLKLDERVENFVKILNSELNLHFDYELEDSEFPYLKNYTREVSGFLDKFGFIDDILSTLLDDKKLKLGLYTYSDFKKKPWEYTNTTVSDYWKLYYSGNRENVNYRNILYFDKFKNSTKYLNYIDSKFSNLNTVEKKLIYLKTTNSLKPSWFYFNKVYDDIRMDKFLYLMGSEHRLVKNIGILFQDDYIENFWKNTNSVFLSMYYHNKNNRDSTLYKIENKKNTHVNVFTFFFKKNYYEVLPKTSIINLNFIYLYVRKYTKIYQPFVNVKYPGDLKAKFEFFIKYYETFICKKHEYFLTNFYIFSPINFNWITKINKIKKLHKNLENFIYFVKKHFKIDLDYFLVAYPKQIRIYYYFGNLKKFSIKFFTKKNTESGLDMFDAVPIIKKKLKWTVTLMYVQKASAKLWVSSITKYFTLNLYLFLKLYETKNIIFLNFYFNWFKNDFKYLHNFIFICVLLQEKIYYFNFKVYLFKIIKFWFYFFDLQQLKKLNLFLENNNMYENLTILRINDILYKIIVRILILEYLGFNYFNFKKYFFFFYTNCLFYFNNITFLSLTTILIIYKQYSLYLNFMYTFIFDFLFNLNFFYFLFIFSTFFNNYGSSDFFNKIYDVDVSFFFIYCEIDYIIEGGAVNFIYFSYIFDYKLLYIIFLYGEYVDFLYKMCEETFLFYLELYNYFGYLFIVDRFSIYYLKRINIWYSKTFTRIVPYHTEYYVSITTDLLDKFVQLSAKGLKYLVFFLLNFTKKYINFLYEINNSIDLLVLKNFKTYHILKLSYKKICNNVLFYLDIFIFQQVLEQAVLLFLNIFYFFYFFIFFLFNKLDNFFLKLIVNPIIKLTNDSFFFFLYSFLNLTIKIYLEIMFLFNVNFFNNIAVLTSNIFYLFYTYVFKQYTSWLFFLKYYYIEYNINIYQKLPNYIIFCKEFNFNNFKNYYFRFILFFDTYLLNFLKINFNLLVYLATGIFKLINTLFQNKCVSYTLYNKLNLNIICNFYPNLVKFLNISNEIILFFSNTFTHSCKKYFNFIFYSIEFLMSRYFLYLFVFIKQIQISFHSMYIRSIRDIYIKVTIIFIYANLKRIVYVEYFKVLKFKLFLFLVWVEDVYLFDFNIKLSWFILKFNLKYWYIRFSLENVILTILNEISDNGFIFYITELLMDKYKLTIPYTRKLKIFLNSFCFYFFYLQNLNLIYTYIAISDKIPKSRQYRTKVNYSYTLFFKYSIINNNWSRLFSFGSGRYRWKNFIKSGWNHNTFKRIQVRTFKFWFSYLKFKINPYLADNNFSIFLFYKKWIHVFILNNINSLYFLINKCLVCLKFRKINLNLNKILLFKRANLKEYPTKYGYKLRKSSNIEDLNIFKIKLNRKKNNIIFLSSSLNLNILLFLEIFFSKKNKNTNNFNKDIYANYSTFNNTALNYKTVKCNINILNSGFSLNNKNNFFKFSILSGVDLIISYLKIKIWYGKNTISGAFKNLNLNWHDFVLWRFYTTSIKKFEKLELYNFDSFGGFLFIKSTVSRIKNINTFKILKYAENYDNFIINDIGIDLFLNFLNYDNIVSSNLLFENKKHNTSFSKVFYKGFFFKTMNIYDKTSGNFKIVNKNYFNLQKHRKPPHKILDPKNMVDLLNIKIFFNFFNKINNNTDYIVYKKKDIFIKKKYQISFVENLKINNLLENSPTNTIFTLFSNILHKLINIMKIIFNFFKTNNLNFTPVVLTYYTEFDKKLIFLKLQSIFNSNYKQTTHPLIYKFGSINSNRLYRYFIKKVIFARPLILDKVILNYKKLSNNLSITFEQGNILIFFLDTLVKAYEYLVCNFFNYIFWFSHINIYILVYSKILEFECKLLLRITKMLQIYIEFRIIIRNCLYILINVEFLKYYNRFLYHTDKILNSFKNFLDTYFYIELFVEDILKFQLMSQYKLFHNISHLTDIHEVEKKSINRTFYDMYVSDYSFTGEYFYKYLFFYVKFNNTAAGRNTYTLYKLFCYFRVYFDTIIQYIYLFFLGFFYELKSDYQEFNHILYKKYFDLIEEIIEVFDENIFCWIEHYIQNYAQIVWLETIIIFDHIFEYLTEVDYELEDSPFSLFLEEFKTISTSFLRGIPFYEVDYSSFDFNEWSEFNSAYTENDNFHGFSDIDVEDGLGFLGWGFNDEIGVNPGNEFSTLNDISEIPEFLEKILLFDVNDFYNNIFGLDDPQLGNLQPSFDISLPLKSLWVIGAVYYDPFWGGAALIDIEGLLSFLKILYVDRRTFWFNNLFILQEYKIVGGSIPGIIFLKFKIIYLFYDFLQTMDLIYFSIFDILHFWIFYLLYIFEILGVFTVISTFIFFLIFLKLNNIFEKKERVFTRNNFNVAPVVYNFWNYFIFRYFYIVLSNSILFFKMSISVLVLLTLSYIFSEGLHMFSVLRIFDVSQESTLFLNAQYFILERDPFVEKHNPADEVFDQFKYESSIDDEWSRIHYNRETAEILGGPGKEQPSVIDSLGFGKKFNISFDAEDDAEEIDTTLSIDSRFIVDQIHNNFTNEYSFMPNFFQDSILDREFFRESESYGEEIEGSLDFLNRSENRITDLWFDFNFEDMHDEQNLQGSVEFEEEEDLWDSELYGALLLNMADPKWLYTYSSSLTAQELTPQIVGTNQTQLYANSLDNKFHFYDKLNNSVISQNRVLNLLNRNKGKILYNPILDFYDEDSTVDWGLDINNEYGTSMGTVSNLIDTWDDHTADPITQLTRHSNNPSIVESLLFNYTSTDDVLPPNYYAGEDLIFENFFDSVFNTRVFGFKNSIPSATVDDPWDEESHIEEIDTDSYDNFFPKIGRFAMIEDNYKNKNFVNDYMPEGYFNLTSYVFKDLHAKTKSIVNSGNFNSLNLENIRKRNLAYKKLEGVSPANIFYDDMVSDDLDKLIYFNLENTNANWGNTSFYKNNEFSQKMDLSQKNIWWTPNGNEHGMIYFDEIDQGHKDPYAEHLNENDYDLVDFLRSEEQEEWFVSDIFHDRISQLKSVMKKRKWKPQRDLVSDNLKIHNSIQPNWYLYDFNIENKNFNKTKTKGLKYIFIPKFFENKKLLNYFSKQAHSDINYLKSKQNNLLSEHKDTSDANIFFNTLSKDNKNLLNIYVKKKIKNILNDYIQINEFEYFDDLVDIQSSSDLSLSLLIDKGDNYLTNSSYFDFKKIKPSLTYFLKNNFKLNKNKINNNFTYINNSNLLNDSDYSAETYNVKLEQYLNSFEGDFNNFNLDAGDRKTYSDIKDFVFFNKKWSIDNLGKVHYSLFTDNNQFNLNAALTKIKDSNGTIRTKLQSINKNVTKSVKVREFAANPDRGYWSELKDEMSQDERLTGILNPKIIENPIFLNDSESFKEFSEMWNIDFGRKNNNLEILGMGQPRELALFDHYSNTSDFNPLKHEIPINGEWANYDDEDSEFYGVDDSNFEIDDKLRAGESWYGFNFDIGKNWYKYRLANFSKLIENELLSKKHNNKINWFNFEKFGIKQKEKNYKNPWALDITTKYNFAGSQNWNFQKNDETFLKLLSSGSFKIFNNENAESVEFTKAKINTQNIKNSTKSQINNKKQGAGHKYMSFDHDSSNSMLNLLNLYGGEHSDIQKVVSELRNENFTGLDVNLPFDDKIKFLKNIKNTDILLSKNTSSNFESLQNNINTTTHSLEYDPDEYSTNIDMNWDADLKFDYSTRFYQYGRMFRSLNQNNIILDHFKSNIALDNIAITPDQSSDYFWYTYKKHKNNKFDNFFKKINYSRNIPTNNKILKLNFENFIKSPTTVSLKNNTTLEDFNNITTENTFPNLADSWKSGYLDLKLNQNNFDRALPVKDYELLDIDDFDYQNINHNNNWYNRNKKIKNKLKKNIKTFLDNELFVKKEKNDMDILYSLAENVNSISANNNIWWSMHVNRKFKNIKQSKENYLFDNLFGLYIKRWKNKHTILREKNAQIRQKQITKLLFGYASPLKNYGSSSKLWLKFSQNENLINALTNSIKLKNSAILDTKNIQDDQNYNNNFDFDFLENENNENLYNDDNDFFTNFENSPYFINNAITDRISIKNFNTNNSIQEITSGFEDVLFEDTQKLNDISTVEDYENRQQLLSLYLKNKKYTNLTNTLYLNNGVADTINFETNLNNLDYFSDLNAFSSKFNKNNTDTYNYSRWSVNFNNTNYNRGDFSIINLPNTSDTYKNLKYFNLNKTDALYTNNTNFYEDNEYANSLDDSKIYENDYDDWSEYGMDLHYFNNKKQNTLQNIGVDFKSNGIIRPVSFENSTLSAEEVLPNNSSYATASFSEFNEELYESEDSNIFYNLKYYDKSISDSLSEFKKIKIDDSFRFFFKKNIFNIEHPATDNLKIGYLSDLKKIISSQNIEMSLNSNKLNAGDSLVNKINSTSYNKISNLNFDNFTNLSYIKNKKAIDTLDFKTYSNFMEKKHDFHMLKNQNSFNGLVNVWKNKNKNFENDYYYDQDLGSDSYKNVIKKLNKDSAGLKSSMNYMKNSIYLDKYSKTDATFGNSRFFNNENSMISFNKINNKFLGNSKKSKNIKLKQVTKIDNFGYIKNENNIKNYEKDISGFYSNYFNDSLESDLNYIESISNPIIRNIKNKNITNSNENQYFVFNNNNKNNTLLYENTNTNTVDNFLKWNNNRKLGSIFKTNYQNINAKAEKTNNFFRNFSNSESIYPLPIVKSLSVGSNLFNKINSLRLFGAGRLSDYFYNTKLKHLLSSDKQNIDFDDDDDIEYLDDQFLLEFDEDEDLDYWYDDFETEPIILDDTSEDGFVDKNLINSSNRNDSFGLVLENIEDTDALFINFNKSVSDFDFISEYVNFNSIAEDFDIYDVIVDREMEIDTDQSGTNKNLIENLQGYPLKFLFSNNYINQNSLIIDNFSNMSYVDELAYSNFKKIQNRDSQESTYFLNDFDTLGKINLSKIPLQPSKNKINFSNNYNGGFENLLLTTMEDLVDYKDNSKYLENLEQVNSGILNNLEETLDNLENLQDATNQRDINNSKVVKQFTKNINSNFINDSVFMSNQNLNFENYFNVTDYDDLESLILPNSKLNDEFSDDFNDNLEDFEDITNFMSTRFLHYEVPSEKLNSSIHGLNFDSKNNIDTFSNNSLYNRKNLQFTANKNNFYKKNYKKNNKIFTKYSLDSPYNIFFNYAKMVESNQESAETNWFLNRSYWLDIVDEYEYFDDFSSKFEEDFEDSYASLEKLENSQNLENNEILENISEYFINDKILIKNNSDGSDLFLKNTLLSNQNNDYSTKTDTTVNRNSSFSSAWNISNAISKGIWAIKKNNNINFKNYYEKNSNLQIKEELSEFNSNYIFKNGVLNLNNLGNESLKNINTLLRKSNSNVNNNFGIKKFMNLKKKYLTRLDIVEKYIYNLKNNTLFNSDSSTENIGNFLTKNRVEPEKINKLMKPLQINTQNYIKTLHTDKNFNNTQANINYIDDDHYISVGENNVEDFSETEGNTSNKIINFKNNLIFQNFSKFININMYSTENKWVDFDQNNKTSIKTLDIGSEKTYKLNNFYKNFVRDYDDYRELQISLDEDTFFDGNSEYLEYKLDHLKKKIDFNKNYDESIESSFEVLEDDDELLDEEVDSDEDLGEEEEDIFDIYSRIRNDLQKFESNKYGNSFLLPNIVSNFLNSITKLNVASYINEVPKTANYYKNISTVNLQNNYPNNAYDSFLDKESKKSVKRLNNISYFKKLPIFDQFAIYHKKLSRPGLDLNNPYSTIPLDPFRNFLTNEQLYDRSIKYGSGDYIFKNNPVSRRSSDLTARTFGPDIITNSTLLGYGRFDYVSDLHQDDEEDSGIYDNIGYPVVNEQNLYNYDYPDIVDTYITDSIFSIDFLDFMWDIEDEDELSNYIQTKDGDDKYFDGYSPFFDLTENYERLPLFSIFLPANVNLNPDFSLTNIGSWPDFFDYNESFFPKTTFFNLNVTDIDDEVDSSGTLANFDGGESDSYGTDDDDEDDDEDDEDEDFDDSSETGDMETNELGTLLGNTQDSDDAVGNFYKDLGSLSIFDFTPLGFMSTVKWLSYFEDESVDNASFDDEDEDDEDEGFSMSPLNFIYSVFVDPDENDVIDEDNLPKGFIEPAFNSRYFQTWNTSQNLHFEPLPEMSDLEFDEAEDELIDIYSDTINFDLTEEEFNGDKSVVYRYPHSKSTPYDIISKLKTETEFEWDVPPSLYNSKNVKPTRAQVPENDNVGKVYTDSWDHNIGPLGYEEGDTIYENRLLNRGWYPEKIVWNWGIRDQSRIGNDLTTLELLSDYTTSFSHNEENFGIDPDDESLLSLSWAGKNNRLFNFVDDIVEGLGIEEDLPFSPETAKKLWEHGEHEERKTYEKDVMGDPWYFNEDDEEDFYTNYNDPETFYHYKDDLFNTLGFIRFEAESNAWQNSNYFGNLDATVISGSSMALSNNAFYDGLMTDFSNFIYEKFPVNPKNNVIGASLPYTSEGLFTTGDFHDSQIPGFAEYLIDEDGDEEDDEDYEDEEDAIEKDENFNLIETFKPKDTFNFSPNDSSFLIFEPEWVINGEGWLGNVGSSEKIFNKDNVNIKYLNPELDYFSMPKGIHSFEVFDESDQYLGVDSAYFSLSDFQKNRIVRGRDNDISNFPIKSGWNLPTGFTPEAHNLFWKHRMRFGDHEYSIWFESEEFSYQYTNSDAPAKTGIGIPFSDTLMDNPDYIVFNEIEINQRNLWWKSIAGGYLSENAKVNIGINTVLNNNDSYRDFLLSYDYRIFGKSWINPQVTDIPLKSFNFYGDSQINDWLANSDPYFDSNNYTDIKNNYSIFDYTYGHFLNSQTNFEANNVYYSISLRNFLYKAYHLFTVYFNYIFDTISNIVKMVIYLFLDIIFYKFELLYVILNFYKCNIDNNSCSYLLIYQFYKILLLFYNYIVNFILFFENILLIFINISIFDINYIFFEIVFYINLIFLFFKNYLILLKLNFQITLILNYIYIIFFIFLLII